MEFNIVESERNRKRIFISGVLLKVLQACDDRVTDAKYIIDDYGTETCSIIYENGNVLDVNITMDSFAAIVRDVFKKFYL